MLQEKVELVTIELRSESYLFIHEFDLGNEHCDATGQFKPAFCAL